jgi:integrase
MRWEEIDWDKKWWTIPAIRMKRKKDHIVPLSKMALAVLKHQQKISGRGSYVFASNRSKYGHISNGTMNRALNSMGYQGKLCPHDFRDLATTALQEEKGVERIHIDRQLAHVPETKVAAAYNRAEYISSRTDLMEVWGEMLKEAGMTLPE